MAKKKNNLIIVESPAKAKTIKKYVGPGFQVKASVGHVMDLPKSYLGVDIENDFTPKFIQMRDKSKVIKELKEIAAKSEEILVATDPDREGEAIASHVAQILSKVNPNIHRIEFNEITKNAVQKALEHPREIDVNRVQSQQARRVLDRIVGYQVSPLLWKTVARGLSAGRVQSVALRLICELEDEIEKFKPIEYWNIFGTFETDSKETYDGKLFKINNKKVGIGHYHIQTAEQAEGLKKDILSRQFTILAIQKKTLTKKAPAPYITSTLQQDAIRKLNMSSARVMRIAQQLYEGIELGDKGNTGLITYMRTDSTRISNDAIQMAREYIGQEFGDAFLPSKPNIYSRKQKSQDAHEAIRPTYISTDFHPDKIKQFLSRDQYRLYNLIWKRFIACQMTPAKIDRVTLITGDDTYQFETVGETIKFKGFLSLYTESAEDDNNPDADIPTNIPKQVAENEAVSTVDLKLNQEFTKPPSRFTESSLVKKLDQLGIGRPSTYAQIISTLMDRNYVIKEEKKLQPTDLGKTVNKILVQYFPHIFDVKFTAMMEDELDQIENGEDDYLSVMRKFYNPFSETLSIAEKSIKEIKQALEEKTDEKCELCGGDMVIKWGRHGKFKACSNYPECKNTKPLENVEPEKTGESCPQCGKDLVKRSGRYGEFIACSNYPTCKYSKPVTLGVSCPNEGCSGEIVQKRSKRGKLFYGCSNYPDCKFVSWYKPVNIACSNCNHPYLEERITKKEGTYHYCPSCKTKFPVS
ncbi:MAG: type I DNA topoisomerase [Calditrichia bacterium]